MAGILEALGLGEADPRYTYGTILPFRRSPEGQVEAAWPSMIRDTVQGLSHLSAGAAGQMRLGDNIPPEDLLAIAGTGGGAGLRVGSAARVFMENKSARLYNPPTKTPRPFEADYPAGAAADAAGRLTADIEGNPLTARYVVGRNMVGGEDQAFPTAELDALTAATTGRGPEAVAPRALGQNAGLTVVDKYSGPLDVYLRNNLSPEQALRVHAHELGHVIDEIAGQIPTQGLSKELGPVYNTLNNPNRSGADAATWGKPFTPQAGGYTRTEMPREWMAEAIRAYMTDPNYLKTVAPQTAAAIRKAVNTNPRLSPVIQFNAAASPSLLGALAAGFADDGAGGSP